MKIACVKMEKESIESCQGHCYYCSALITSNIHLSTTSMSISLHTTAIPLCTTAISLPPCHLHTHHHIHTHHHRQALHLTPQPDHHNLTLTTILDIICIFYLVEVIFFHMEFTIIDV